MTISKGKEVYSVSQIEKDKNYLILAIAYERYGMGDRSVDIVLGKEILEEYEEDSLTSILEGEDGDDYLEIYEIEVGA